MSACAIAPFTPRTQQSRSLPRRRRSGSRLPHDSRCTAAAAQQHVVQNLAIDQVPTSKQMKLWRHEITPVHLSPSCPDLNRKQ